MNQPILNSQYVNFLASLGLNEKEALVIYLLIGVADDIVSAHTILNYNETLLNRIYNTKLKKWVIDPVQPDSSEEMFKEFWKLLKQANFGVYGITDYEVSTRPILNRSSVKEAAIRLFKGEVYEPDELASLVIDHYTSYQQSGDMKFIVQVHKFMEVL